MSDNSKLTTPGDQGIRPLVEHRSDSVHLDNVDFGQRIITVLAVPYEQPAVVAFRSEMWNEVFSRSAFNGIEGQTRKIPATAVLELHNRGHEGGRLVGKVISSNPYHDSGLVCDVKVSRTDYGDETLELARDEALSASVGFMVKNPKFDQDLDRYTKTRRINRAFLDHLSFVGQPAYEGAGVLAMRAEDAEPDAPLTPTPRMDAFLNDPILKWASERVRGV